jgi:membrane protein implicated in regulation of membrane protease activity
MLPSLSPELIWFLIGLILLIGELAIPALILLFFGVGAWVTVFAVFIGLAPNINIQLLIFIITSILAIALLRQRVGFYKKGHIFGITDAKDGIGSVIGSHAIVMEEIIPNLFSGKVELNGTLWQAVAEVAIKKGTEVEIIEQVNLTVKVKPVT